MKEFILSFPYIPWPWGLFLLFLLAYVAWHDHVRKIVPAWLVLPVWVGACLWRSVDGHWLVLAYVVVFVLEEFFFPQLLGLMWALVAAAVTLVPDLRVGFLLAMWSALITLFHYLHWGGVSQGLGGGDIWMLILLFTFFPYPTFAFTLALIAGAVGLAKGGKLKLPIGPNSPATAWVYSLAGGIYVILSWLVNGGGI